MGAQGQQEDGFLPLVLRVLEDDTQIVSRCKPNNRPMDRAICESATTDAPRQPITPRASPRSTLPYRGVTSATSVGRAQMPASVTACVSRLGLAHQFHRGHGLALSSGELPAGLRHCGCHTLPPPFGEASHKTATNSACTRRRVVRRRQGHRQMCSADSSQSPPQPAYRSAGPGGRPSGGRAGLPRRFSASAVYRRRKVKVVLAPLSGPPTPIRSTRHVITAVFSSR